MLKLRRSWRAAIIEGAGVGATRHSPHHDGAYHIGLRYWKVAHHQGGTFGKQVFHYQRRCTFDPKVNIISRRSRGILNDGVDTLACILVQAESEEKG